jgi:hypothetical protein
MQLIRTYSDKSSSTAEDRLGNALGDNLTAKRRFMKNEMLEAVVHAKRNMFLLDCSQKQQTQCVLMSSFEDVLEFVYSKIDEELFQALDSDIEGEQDPELSTVSDVHESGSDSGNAGDW